MCAARVCIDGVIKRAVATNHATGVHNNNGLLTFICCYFFFGERTRRAIAIHLNFPFVGAICYAAQALTCQPTHV